MTKKFNKKDYRNLTILILMYLFVTLIITHGTFIYGSTTDWSIQHWAIPEYFRSLFYDTKELIPSFAPNLGAGQNIFYFAYYGFLSPIILLSYLFPHIQMNDYISLSSILLGLLSIILFYKWLKKSGFQTNICLLATAIFLCASPLIFQTHRHVMFINYMPFLIMALMSVDLYFERKKISPLIVTTFLIIMTSYFYSVGAILAIVIYGIYVYLRENRTPTLKNFLKEALKFSFPLITAILLAAILLLPVANALLNGRIHGDVPLNITELVIPHFGLEYLLYSPYSVGLTAIVILALFTNLIIKKRDNLFLNIALITIITANFFVYILNGTLYLDGKALIPLLPLYVLAIALFFKRLFQKEIALYNILFMFALTLIIALIFSKPQFTALYALDGLLTVFLISFYYKHQKPNKLIITFIIFIYIICIGVNFGDELETKADHQKQNSPEIADLVHYITKHDQSYYRIYTDVKGAAQHVNRILDIRQNSLTLYSSTYNKDYNKFFYHTFNNNIAYRNSVITHQNKNVMFETYMGVKYLITDKAAPRGYTKVKNSGTYTLYINHNFMPVGYANSQLLNKTQYKALKFPYKLEGLMNNIIVDNAPNKALTSHMQPVEIDLTKAKSQNLKIQKIDHSYQITTIDSQKGELILDLNQAFQDQLLLVRIHVSNPQSCKQGDTSITINGIKNKLTCREWKYYNHNQTFDYTLSSLDNLKNLKLVFSKGNYTINDIQIFALDFNLISQLPTKVDSYNIDYEKSRGSHLEGDINVKKSGYFMLTIPYDSGFTIKVDGQDTAYEKVSGAFIGFPISQGYHQITLDYEAPYLALGKKVSLGGLVILLIVLIRDVAYRPKKVK